jgi:hypothetical protein
MLGHPRRTMASTCSGMAACASQVSQPLSIWSFSGVPASVNALGNMDSTRISSESCCSFGSKSVLPSELFAACRACSSDSSTREASASNAGKRLLSGNTAKTLHIPLPMAIRSSTETRELLSAGGKVASQMSTKIYYKSKSFHDQSNERSNERSNDQSNDQSNKSVQTYLEQF